MSKEKIQVEKSRLWLITLEISEEIYKLIPKLPEEERWGAQSSLRQRAFEITKDVSEAIGSVDPRDAKWHFGMAHRDLFSLESTLHVIDRVGYFTTDPKITMNIELAIKLIDKELEGMTKKIEEWHEEMQPKDDYKKLQPSRADKKGKKK
jgi:four helix bundle protein